MAHSEQNWSKSRDADVPPPAGCGTESSSQAQSLSTQALGTQQEGHRDQQQLLSFTAKGNMGRSTSTWQQREPSLQPHIQLHVLTSRPGGERNGIGGSRKWLGLQQSLEGLLNTHDILRTPIMVTVKIKEPSLLLTTTEMEEQQLETTGAAKGEGRSSVPKRRAASQAPAKPQPAWRLPRAQSAHPPAWAREGTGLHADFQTAPQAEHSCPPSISHTKHTSGKTAISFQAMYFLPLGVLSALLGFFLESFLFYLRLFCHFGLHCLGFLGTIL